MKVTKIINTTNGNILKGISSHTHTQTAKILEGLTEATKDSISPLLKILPETKCSKNLTVLDKLAMKIYTGIIKFREKLNKEEFTEICRNKDNIYQNIYNYIVKVLNIPKEFAPSLNRMDEIPYAMQYLPFANSIQFSTSRINDIEGINEIKLLSLFRHEFQHYLHNLDILRTEKLGLTAIDSYANTLIKNTRTVIESNTTEKLIEMGINKEIAVTLKGEDKEAIEKLWENEYTEIKNTFMKLREYAIKEKGIIKDGSNEALRSKQLYTELSGSYYSSDGKIKESEYFSSLTENEAYLAGDAWALHFEKDCPFKKIKEGILYGIKYKTEKGTLLK